MSVPKGYEDYDFSGYATRYNVRCKDGRTIGQRAFEHMDNKEVPILYQHDRYNPENVLGMGVLQHRDDGVYVYGKFNTTERGQTAKTLVEDKNIKAMSIFANNLSQTPDNFVTHGDIQEVSLVLAGANPSATIDNVMYHSEEGYDYYLENDYYITTGDPIEIPQTTEEDFLQHSDEPSSGEGSTMGEVYASLNDDQQNMLKIMVDLTQKNEAPSAELSDALGVIYSTLDDKQATLVDAIITDTADESADNIQHSGGNDYMKENAFEQYGQSVDNGYYGTEEEGPRVLQHSDQESILKGARNRESLKDYLFAEGLMDDVNFTLQHAHPDSTVTIPAWAPDSAIAVGDGSTGGNKYGMGTKYGFDHPEYVLPDYHGSNAAPKFVGRDKSWVQPVLRGVKHTPFSRIKSRWANIDGEEARARGYITGDRKEPEVFKLLKRTTDPTTILKMQEIDRDILISITDFNVVAWMKEEMQIMLDEEKARAILIGDGRPTSDRKHIDEEAIRPIWKDDKLYVIRKTIDFTPAAEDRSAKTDIVIDTLYEAMETYKGTGAQTMFIAPAYLRMMLLSRDKIGRRLYNNESELASALGVSSIIRVPIMDKQKDEHGNTLIALVGNLNDYEVGSDRQGQRTMFDDFDINFNKYQYLMEERFCGSLTMPDSFIVLQEKAGEAA